MQFVCLHHSIRSTFANWSIKLFEVVALAGPQLSTISIINTLHRSLTIYWNCIFFEAENRPLICLIRIKTIQVFSVCSIIYTILSRVWLNSSSIIDFNTLSSGIDFTFRKARWIPEEMFVPSENSAQKKTILNWLTYPSNYKYWKRSKLLICKRNFSAWFSSMQQRGDTVYYDVFRMGFVHWLGGK